MRIIEHIVIEDPAARTKYWVCCDAHKQHFDLEIPEGLQGMGYSGSVRAAIEELGRRLLDIKCTGCVAEIELPPGQNQWPEGSEL